MQINKAYLMTKLGGPPIPSLTQEDLLDIQRLEGIPDTKPMNSKTLRLYFQVKDIILTGGYSTYTKKIK